MTESETGTPTAASVPPTPETPGGPLFSSVRIDSLDRESFAMGRCNMCLPGAKSNGCIGVRIPSVSLTQKKGAFSIAAKTKVPVVPITLIGTGQIMPAGRESIVNTGFVKVVIHKPIDGNDPDMLCKEARNKIASVLTQA